MGSGESGVQSFKFQGLRVGRHGFNSCGHPHENARSVPSLLSHAVSGLRTTRNLACLFARLGSGRWQEDGTQDAREAGRRPGDRPRRCVRSAPGRAEGMLRRPRPASVTYAGNPAPSHAPSLDSAARISAPTPGPGTESVADGAGPAAWSPARTNTLRAFPAKPLQHRDTTRARTRA